MPVLSKIASPTCPTNYMSVHCSLLLVLASLRMNVLSVLSASVMLCWFGSYIIGEGKICDSL